MPFTTEIQNASTANREAARRAAQVQGIKGEELGQAVLAGRWISIDDILKMNSITQLTWQESSKILALAKPYAWAGWMIDPGAGNDIEAMLKNSKFRIGGTGAPTFNENEAEAFVKLMRMIDGIIANVSMIVPHGQLTAPKSKDFDAIAVKFVEDHFCNDVEGAKATSQRRALARSTMLKKDEGNALSREVVVLNEVRYFQYVEEYLKKRYGFDMDYKNVESICYLSKSKINVAWQINGTASDAGVGTINQFSEPAKINGHLIYAVKPDEADKNANGDVSKCKRIIYHFEGIVPDVKSLPFGSEWIEVTLDDVLKVANKANGNDKRANELTNKLRAAAVPCFFRPGNA